MASFTWLFVHLLKNPRAVDEFLASVGATLPEALRAGLAAHNGGIPSDGVFDTDACPGYDFKGLLSYNEGDLESVQELYPLLFAREGLYPIALEGSGDSIQYDCAAGGLLLLRHETGEVERILPASNPPLFSSLGIPGPAQR